MWRLVLVIVGAMSFSIVLGQSDEDQEKESLNIIPFTFSRDSTFPLPGESSKTEPLISLDHPFFGDDILLYGKERLQKRIKEIDDRIAELKKMKQEEKGCYHCISRELQNLELDKIWLQLRLKELSPVIFTPSYGSYPWTSEPKEQPTIEIDPKTKLQQHIRSIQKKIKSIETDLRSLQNELEELQRQLEELERSTGK